MEKQITNDQEKLLTLQEKSLFLELTKEEQLFVRQFSTPEEFDQIHIILSESMDVYTIPEPKPLILSGQNKKRVLPFLIPISSAAAAAILTFFIFRKETIVLQQIEKPVYMTADTVYINKENTDTIIRTKYLKENSTKQVNEKNSLQIPVLSEENVMHLNLQSHGLENKGQSASEDNTVALIEGKRI